MAFTEVGNEVDTNETTNVIIVPAPAASHRHVVSSVHIDNTDTVTRTASIFKDKGGTARRLAFASISANASFTFNRLTVLDATNETLYVVMGETTTTNDPTVDVSYADVF